MKVSKAIALSLFGSFGLLATSAWGTEAPEYVRVGDVTTAGSGCPLGTVAKNVSDDKTAFTLLFSEYLAEKYPGSSPSAARRNCNITVDLEFPEGWTYSVVSFDYRGYAALDEGMEATAQASYYFQSDSHTASFASTLAGPKYDTYHFRDELGLDAVIWSPDCSGDKRALNLSTEVRVADEGAADWAQGIITVDSFDSQFAQKYSLVWRRCDDGGGSEEPDDGSDWDYRPGYDDQFPEAPADFSIDSLTVNGSGCKLGSSASLISDDRRAFTLLFDSFYAEAGPGLSFRDARKNCQITVDLDYPDGWTFALATFDYRGFSFLEEGVTAQQTAYYYFQGESNQFTRKETLPGGYNDLYHFRDYVPLDALRWAPCGKKRALNVNSSIFVNNLRNRGNSGLITMDSVDGEFGAYHGLVWRRCR
jgi:hypothetical protein